MTLVLLLTSILLLPADRLAMADRLFNRGRYDEAAAEYRLLEKEPSVAADAVQFRLAECDRAAGRAAAAQSRFGELVRLYPDSEFADSARLQLALASSGAERQRQLAALDSDRVRNSVRAAALYQLGRELRDADRLARAIAADPDGPYADYAKLQRGTLLAEAKEEPTRRKGMEQLLDLGFGRGPLAEEALYLAAISSYRSRRYGEAGSLFRRYRRNFPQGQHGQEARTLAVWSDFLNGRYADAAAACGDGNIDDLAYLRACCAEMTGDPAAVAAFRDYLERFAAGNYRKEAELRLGRLEFAEAAKGSNTVAVVAAARRVYAQSQAAADALRLGWAYERAGSVREAEALYRKTVEAAPGTAEAAEALYAAAMLAARAEEWPKVEVALAEAMASGKLGERQASAGYWRGMAAKALGHPEEAVNFLKAALELGLGLDEAREARLVLAEADYRAGREAAAKAEYARLVGEGACARMNASLIHAVGKLLDGEPRAICAQALIESSSPEWRQAGWALKGEYEEARQGLTAAMAAYRAALKEPVRTAEAAWAALRLGRLETRAGEYARAEASLREAVQLSAKTTGDRAEAYLALAENAEASGDFRAACGYATAVVALFQDSALAARAERILKAHPEAAK